MCKSGLNTRPVPQSCEGIFYFPQKGNKVECSNSCSSVPPGLQVESVCLFCVFVLLVCLCIFACIKMSDGAGASSAIWLKTINSSKK